MLSAHRPRHTAQCGCGNGVSFLVRLVPLSSSWEWVRSHCDLPAAALYHEPRDTRWKHTHTHTQSYCIARGAREEVHTCMDIQYALSISFVLEFYEYNYTCTCMYMSKVQVHVYTVHVCT